MRGPSRRTLDSVGGLGDILKDAAALGLARALADAAGAPRLLYVHAHAFQLRAACRDPEAWLREASALLAEHEAYYDYFRREHGVSKGGSYRRTLELVLDAVARERLDLVLTEPDSATRCLLEVQLLERGVTPALVLEGVQELRTAPLPPPQPGLLALLDPVHFDSDEWAAFADATSRLAAPDTRGALVAYAYDQGEDPWAWPPAPAGLDGPLARVDRGPHHLALYATPAFAAEATKACSDLGWIDPAAPPPPPKLPDWVKDLD